MHQPPYRILGVSEDASLEEINRAYKEKARKYHPDKSDCPNDLEKFFNVQRAYNYLISELKSGPQLRKNREIEYECEEQHVSGGMLIGHCRCGAEVSLELGSIEKGHLRTQCPGCSLMIVFNCL